MKDISFMLMAIALMLGLAATQNTTISDKNITEQAKWRQRYCRRASLPDNRYNQTRKDYYRSLRAPIFANNVEKAFRYYVTGSTNTWLTSQRWAVGLLIVVASLAFIFWIVSLVFCCSKDEQQKNPGAMKSGIISAWVILFLFLGLFVFIIIMIAASEIFHRRSSCSVYTIGYYLVQGHHNIANGNDYIGLLNYRRILENVQAEAPNLPLAFDNSNSIINSNVDLWASSARNSLRSVYLANSGKINTGVLTEKTQTDFYSTLTRTINPSIGADFGRLQTIANAQVNTAQAIRTMTLSANQGAVSSSINQAKVVLQRLAIDIADTNIGFANEAWWRNMYNRGAYWFILGISIIVLIAVAVILCSLGKLWNGNYQTDNRGLMKALLAIVAFFIIWYAICVIFLVVGSTSIATFCKVLANLNEGKTHAIDTLNLRFNTIEKYGLTKAAIKECVVGQGDLFQFVYTNPNLANPWNTDVINSLNQIIKGLVANKAWVSNPRKTSGSAALTNYFNNLTLTSTGVQEGAAGAVEQIQKLNLLSIKGNQAYSPSNAACSAYSLTGQTCIQGDVASSSAISGFASGAQFVPHFNNLKAYIASEAATASELRQQLSGTNTTAQFQYTTANQIIWENQIHWANITRTVPLTISSLSSLRATTALFDCRGLRIELYILEDQLCFKLNFFIWLITIIAAISLLLLLILFWVVYAAIRNAPGLGDVEHVPTPMTKEDPALDIDGKELIPNM